MAENSAISWTDHTFNPWEGCQKVGPGCDNCYAEARNARFNTTAINWGPGAPRRRTSVSNWNLPLKWDRQAKAAGVRARVFCASLADVFDNMVDPQWRLDLYALIRATPNLDWLLLTKRVGNVNGWGLPLAEDGCNVLPNLWIGATIVNQEEADRDIPKLLEVPARVRFLSMEPLLGPVSLLPWIGAGHAGPGGAWCQGVQWVIVGGESGTNARPMHPDWARSLRDQCAAAGVPFHFKQIGDAVPVDSEVDCDHGPTIYPLDADVVLPGERYRIHQHDGMEFVRVPNKGVGRLLDGVEHAAFPEPRP